MKILITHGRKLKMSGEIHEEYIARLDLTVEVCQKNNLDKVILLGAQTRKNTVSEARAGYEYIKNRIKVPIILDEDTRSCSEQVRAVKKMVNGANVHEVYAVMGKTSMARLKYLYKKLWPEMYIKIKFISAEDFYPSFFYIIEKIYFIFALIDPHEKVFVRFTKKIFRNG